MVHADKPRTYNVETRLMAQIRDEVRGVRDELRSLRDELSRGPAEPDDGTVAISEPARPEVTIRHKGAGYYVLSVNGEDVDQVRGQEAAEARAEELRSGDG